MKNMRSLLSSLLLLACILCGTSPAFAQGTNLGSIRGRVTDQNGAAVPKASVQVTDVETNLSRDLTSNEEGEYEASALKLGTYRVTVTLAGFSTQVIRVVLTGTDPVRADATLGVGGAVENVEVLAEAGVIQTESPAISGSITNQQLVQLPRENRDIYSFLFLNPNITQGATGEDSFKFIGSTSYGANFTLDGQRANGGIFGANTGSQPSLEVIQELNVLTNNFSAEYGGIANIRVVTKRGGDKFHGSLFYTNRNSALAAWRLQDKNAQAAFVPTSFRSKFETPYFNLNEVGGSFSGPVPFSKKTFFLTSYERRWDVAPLTVNANNVPTSRMFGGDFTMLNANVRPVVGLELLRPENPYGLSPDQIAQIRANSTQGTTDLNGDGVVNNNDRRFNVIPSFLLNPIAQNILNTYYPQTGNALFNPANGRLTPNYYQNLSGMLTRDLFTARADHDFSDKDKFYGVYNFQHRDGIRSLTASPLVAFGFLEQVGDNHTLALSYTRIFSNTVVNELRGGFNIQNQFRRAPQTNREFLTTIGLNEQEITAYGSVVGPSLVDTPGQLAFAWAGFPGIPNGGRNVNRTFDQSQITFGDTLTWIAGNHTFKFGADAVQSHAKDDFVQNRGNPRGAVTYQNNLTGFGRFLIGLPPNSVSYVSNPRPVMDVTNWETGFFVQDDFKVRPDLTLNLGVRYELITPFVDKNDLYVNFDPNNASPNGKAGRFIIPSAEALPFVNTRIVQYGLVTADEAGLGRGLVQTDRNNIAPRLGLAWRLNEGTVIRGGYGIFYPTAAAQGQRDALASTPFNQTVTKSSTAAAPLGGLPGGINPRGIVPFQGGAVTTGGLSANAIPTDLVSPRIEQFNVTFEREVGWKTGVRLSYLGSRMHGLIAGVDLNMLAPNDIPYGTTTGDGVTICDPDNSNPARQCQESAADRARRPFPELGAYLASYGNIGNGRSHAFQTEVNRRFSAGLTFHVSYTLLDQKSSGLDVGASSLGGTIYNQFNPQGDYSPDAFVSRHRLVTYGTYDLPFGRGRAFGKEMNRALDAVAGGWQLTWNGFAKTGTGFTPFWTCGNCGLLTPGNMGSSFPDPVGAFSGITGYRATVVSGQDPNLRNGDQFFNPAAFGLPSVGGDVLDDPNAYRRNSLTGPGTMGLNLGLRKNFRFTEQTRLEFGADFNNVFNHPLRSPLDPYFANVGTFNLSVNQQTGKVFIDPVNDVTRNTNSFGLLNNTFSQEGIEGRRMVRFRLRFTF